MGSKLAGSKPPSGQPNWHGSLTATQQPTKSVPEVHAYQFPPLGQEGPNTCLAEISDIAINCKMSRKEVMMINCRKALQKPQRTGGEKMPRQK